VSSNTRVVLALVAGIGLGLVLAAFPGPFARVTVSIVEPFGVLFVNAIRMTVVPLVVATLIVGIASAGNASVVARLGGRGLAVFAALLLVSGVAGALVAPPVFARIALDPGFTASLRAQAEAGASPAAIGSGVQGPGAWLASLIPSNPIAAAADGSLLPLIVFALLLGLALRSLDATRRDRVVSVVGALGDATLVLVRWILVVAPIGVFALALPMVARLGFAAVGALAAYVTLVSVGAAALVVLIVYPAATIGGGLTLRAFARAVAPAQVVAVSSRSSLAALPAMIEAARDTLGLGPEVAGFFLPLAVALFRVAAPLSMTVGTVFIARLYGVSISTTQLATIVLVAVITSFSVPGIPGGSILVIVPVLASVGLPVAGVGILLGADTIPDIVRTMANVTGQMAATVIVSRPAAAAALRPSSPGLPSL
jgi:proton glutamate symport protein